MIKKKLLVELPEKRRNLNINIIHILRTQMRDLHVILRRNFEREKIIRFDSIVHSNEYLYIVV